MPLYEYVCEETGERVEVLRPSAEADGPMEDPAGMGRSFKRVLSTFAAKGSGAPMGMSVGGGAGGMGGCCPCGKTAGGCGSR